MRKYRLFQNSRESSKQNTFWGKLDLLNAIDLTKCPQNLVLTCFLRFCYVFRKTLTLRKVVCIFVENHITENKTACFRLSTRNVSNKLLEYFDLLKSVKKQSMTEPQYFGAMGPFLPFEIIHRPSSSRGPWESTMTIIRPCRPLGLRPECLGLAFPFLNSRKLCHTNSIYEESYSRFPQARRTRGTAIWR